MEFTTPLTECLKCGHSLTVSTGRSLGATLFGLGGTAPCFHQKKRCSKKRCGASYSCNYVVDNGFKRNSLTIAQLEHLGVVFVHPTEAFEIRYLRYREELLFRATSAQAIHYAGNEVLFERKVPLRWWRELYYDALMYYLAVRELPLSYAKEIVIGDEISPDALVAYDAETHEQFATDNAGCTVLSMDGREKVFMKCSADEGRPKRSGAPRKDGVRKPFYNGWFMVVNPENSKVVCVLPEYEPEGNNIRIQAIGKVIGSFPEVDALVHDNICKCEQRMRALPKFSGIDFYIVDRFHAYRHSKKCRCNPWFRKRLNARIKGVNTSVSEQVFFWFRKYSSIINPMRQQRHRFLVLLFCKKHNRLCKSGAPPYLNAHTWQKSARKTGKKYACSTGTGGKKVKPSLKKPITNSRKVGSAATRGNVRAQDRKG